MLEEEPTPGGLVPVPAVRAGKFHTAHKLTREVGTRVPASRHGPRPLGKPRALALHRDGPAGRRSRLVADAGKRDWEELTAEYGAMLMEGLSVMGCKRSGRGQACERAPAPDGLPEK